LKGKGFTVDHLPSLAGACAALPVAVWDAVLLDLHLPDGDGLSLIPAFRRQSADILIVVLTTNGVVVYRDSVTHGRHVQCHAMSTLHQQWDERA
jgi:two-component system OmpR family response regulator